MRNSPIAASKIDDTLSFDVDVILCRETIPSGLAKRVNSNVDGSVQKVSTAEGSSAPSKYEIRVLDFTVVE